MAVDLEAEGADMEVSNKNVYIVLNMEVSIENKFKI